jgi:hypothetical protein
MKEAIFNELQHGWTRLSCHVCLSQMADQLSSVPTFPMYSTKEGFGVGVGEAFASGVIMKI